MAVLIGVCVLPFALVTIAMAATTLGNGLEGVGGTQAAGIMIIGGAVTLSAACVCCGLTTCKLVFFEGAAWCHDGDGIGDPDTCSGLNDCCSGFCSLIAGLLCYPHAVEEAARGAPEARTEALGEKARPGRQPHVRRIRRASPLSWSRSRLERSQPRSQILRQCQRLRRCQLLRLRSLLRRRQQMKIAEL